MSDRKEIPFGRPWISDEGRQAVLDVLNGHVLTHGPQGKAFEGEFGAFIGDGAHCLSVSSCMAALHMACLHVGLKAGDDAIVPAMTHTATAHAVEWTGARPVFVDCDRRTGNMTPEAIEAALTPATRAIVVVHYVGVACDMAAIMALAERRNLRVIEDCAIALGSRFDGRHVGMFGDAGCFSFYPVKHITTGEGGMLITRHKAVADAIGKLRAFGVDRTYAERSIPGAYDVPTLGLNYRMSEMQAALGRTQLRQLEENLARRRRNFERLKAGLRALDGVSVVDSHDARAGNSHYCLTAVVDDALGPLRNEIVGRLNAAGVGTSIYYPQPVPRMTYYRQKYGYDASRYPHASALADGSVALPVGPHVTVEDMDYISRAFQRALEDVPVHGR